MHPYFLRRYAQLLQPGGELLFKHDDRDFFCWSLEQLVAEKWQITELSFDLHESSLDDEYKIMTTYEQRWLNEGKTINFVKTRVFPVFVEYRLLHITVEQRLIKIPYPCRWYICSTVVPNGPAPRRGRR